MSELPNCLKFRSANAKDLRGYCRLSEVGSPTTVKCLSPSNSGSPWEWGREHFKRGLFLDKNNLFPRYLSYQRSLPVHDSRPRESLSVQDPGIHIPGSIPCSTTAEHIPSFKKSGSTVPGTLSPTPTTNKTSVSKVGRSNGDRIKYLLKKKKKN